MIVGRSTVEVVQQSVADRGGRTARRHLSPSASHLPRHHRRSVTTDLVDAKLKVKGRLQLYMVTHHKSTERHLPYEITPVIRHR